MNHDNCWTDWSAYRQQNGLPLFYWGKSLPLFYIKIKSLWTMKWTIENLKELVNNHEEETNTLEFKDADALSSARLRSRDKEELMKDISAMANSNGGIIIFGIQETKDKDCRGKADKLTSITDPKLTKEWLEQIISSNITPKIKDIVITKLTVDDGSWFFILDIPQSNTAHQAPDKKYYKRYNFISSPMDDWELKDIINRQNKPEIEISLTVQPLVDMFSRPMQTSDITISLTNKGMVAAKYINCFVEIQPELRSYIISPQFSIFKNKYQTYFENRASVQVVPGTLPAPYEPLLPNITKSIGTIRVHQHLFSVDSHIKCMVATETTFTEKDFLIADILPEK